MTRAWILAFASLLPPGAVPAPPDPPGYVAIAAAYPADERLLEGLRARGDLDGERRHLWQVYAGLTRSRGSDGLPAFMTWYGAVETFGRAGPAASPRALAPAFAVPLKKVVDDPSVALPPLIVRTHYNSEALHHIREHGLNQRATLRSLIAASAATAPREVPAFPRAAAVLKTVWWPAPATGAVALPVWDAALNPSNAQGNDYPTWPRLVGVCGPVPAIGGAVDAEFLGRVVHAEHCVSRQLFYTVVLDAPLAALVMRDPAARNLAAMVLGRPLRTHDVLLLVGMHVATREITDWVWGTFWWHDRPNEGEYAAARPDELPAPWSSYLMSVAFDAELPHEPDGSPHVAYNPWFEARFADRGHGNGVVSNCMSCHRRAAFPAAQPFVVSRGRTVPVGAARVESSALWSIPLQAR